VTDRIVVSGIGIVGPGTFGRAALVRAFPALPQAEEPRRVAEFALETHLEGGRAFRRASGATAFALAAMGLAVADAGFSVGTFGGQDAGIVVGITHGGAAYSVQFHRELTVEGCLAASPLHFAESVPNAPAGNAAIAFRVRGPVHTLIGEEPVGTQVIDVAADLLRTGLVSRCLVAGTEEWSDVVAHAYGQVDRARRARRGAAEVDSPPLSEGAAALVLEVERVAAARGGRPQAVLDGWALATGEAGGAAGAMASAVAAACRAAGRRAAEVDHVVLPTREARRAAREAGVAARGPAGPPVWVDLADAIGNPPGASNLLQVAVSAALLSAGTLQGPGLVLSAGLGGTVSAVVLSRPVGAPT
jgi:3-oxoacyl-[acyl-carrier-protein] synthase II